MGRVVDWRTRLLDYLARSRGPFEYGKNDCVIFAMGAAGAMTGENYVGPYIRHYHTLLGGMRLLHKHGYRDHIMWAASLFEEVHPAYAAPGDLAVLPGADGVDALGVVQGSHVYVLLPIGKIGLMPRTGATRAFRV